MERGDSRRRMKRFPAKKDAWDFFLRCSEQRDASKQKSLGVPTTPRSPSSRKKSECREYREKARNRSEKRVAYRSEPPMNGDVSVIRVLLLPPAPVPDPPVSVIGRRTERTHRGAQHARIFFSNLIYRQFDGRKTRRHFCSTHRLPLFSSSTTLHPTTSSRPRACTLQPPPWPLLPPPRGAA